MSEIKDFQQKYTKKAIQFWTTRPYALHTREQLAKRPYGVEAQFLHETSESLKSCCFDLTNRPHDYDNDVEVRTGKDLTHRVLYLCATPDEAEKIVQALSGSHEIRVHKLY